MTELAHALEAFLCEVCSASAKVAVPRRTWIRAVPAPGDSGLTYVWRFEYAAPGPDWAEVSHIATRDFERFSTVEGVRAAAASLRTFPVNADNGGVMWVLNEILLPVLQRYFSDRG